MRIQTPQKRVQFAYALRTVVLGVFAVFVASLALSLLTTPKTNAATSNYLNFQARLETASGAIVPDGNYNVSFHLFNASSASGTSTDTGCGTDTTCEWTELHTYNSGAGATDARIRVANGYLTVSLGSITGFGSINWNQEQWLTMDIGGTSNSSVTWDGQMAPRIQLTAVPYAFQAGELGNGTNKATLTSSGDLQLQQASTISTTTGNLTLQSASALAIQTAAGGTSSNLTIQTGNASAGASGNISIDNGTFTSGTPSITIGGTNARSVQVGNATSSTTLTLQGGTGGVNLGTGGVANTIQIGNTTGAVAQTINIGTNATASSTSNIVIGSTVAGTTQLQSVGGITIGKASSVDGKLIFANSGGSNTITIQTSSGAAAYTLTLPTTGPSTTQCLQTDSVTASQLKFGSCGAGFSPTLAGVYNNATSTTDNIISLLSTKGPVVIRDDATPLAGNDLFTIQNNGATTNFLSVRNNGFDLLGAGNSTVTTSSGTLTLQGASNAAVQAGSGGTISIGTTNNNSLAIGTGTTSGTIQLGGTGTSGNITIGQWSGTSGTQTINIGSNVGSGGTQAINIGTSGTAGSTSNITLGSTIAGLTTLQSASGVAVSTLGTTNSVTYLCRNGSNIIAACQTNATGSAFVQGGNNFGGNAALGTTGASQTLAIETAGSNRLIIDTSATTNFTLQQASILSTSTGSLTVQSATGLTLQTAGGTTSSAISITTGTATGGLSGSITIDNGGFTSGTPLINIGTSNSRQVQIGNNTAATTVSIQGGTGASALSIQTGANGTISVGTTAQAQTIQIGTTATNTGNTQTIGIGNLNAAGTTDVNIGSGTSATGGTTTITGKTAVNITGYGASTWQTSGAALSITGGTTLALQSTTSSAISLDSGTSGAVNIATGANSKTVQIGASSSAITDTINIGNNANASAVSTITVGSASSNSSLLLQAGTGNLQIQTQGGTLGIGNNAVAQTLTIGNTTGATAITLQSGTGAINLQTQGTGGINIATNAVAQTVTIGNTNGASSVVLQAGTGGVQVATLTAWTSNSAAICRDTGTNKLTACDTSNTSGTAFLQGGNSFGATGTLGTNDGYSLAFKTNNTTRLVVDTSGSLQFQQASTLSVVAAASGLQLTVKAGDANSSNNKGGDLVLQGGAPFGTGSSGGVIVQANGAESGNAFQVQDTFFRDLFTADTKRFRVSVSSIYLTTSAPTSLACPATCPTSGGSLAAGTYLYEVTAVDAVGGETVGSNEITVVSTGSQKATLTWTGSSSASAYKVYRTAAGGASGTEKYLTTVLTTTFTDSGTITLSSTALPTSATAATTISQASSNQLQLTVGGSGKATGQLYVSGVATKLSSVTGVGTTLRSTYVQGRYLYVIDYALSKLLIYDTNNPLALSLISSTSTNGGPTSVMVHGSYAYVTNYDVNTFQIFDVSNPASPSSIASISTLSGNSAASMGPRAVAIQGRYAYVLGYDNQSLQVYDIANPANPVLAGILASGFTSAQLSKITVNGAYAYITDPGTSKIYIVNVSNPLSPSIATSFAAGGNPQGIAVQGRYLYVSRFAPTNQLAIFDISNPPSTSATAVGVVSTDSGPQDIFPQDRFVYVACHDADHLCVVDVSNPVAPVLLSSLSGITSATNIFVSGRYAYINSNTDLYVVDLGGTYTQQLESGGIETGNLQVLRSAIISGNTTITGGLQVASSANISGSFGVYGTAYFQGAVSLDSGIQGGATISGLSTPSTPTVTATCSGTCATTYNYKVTAVSAAGGETPASSQSSNVSNAATLDGTHYNTITWSLVSGAVSYKVYRTVGGATQGLIGTTNATEFVDTGIAGSGSAPTADTSGLFTVNGNAIFKNTVDSATSLQIQNSSGTNILTADTTNQRIGIGAITPARTLDVKGGTLTVATSSTYAFGVGNTAQGDFTIGSDSSYVYLQSWNTKPLQINNQGNNIYLDATGGSVGIGTTSVNRTLDVNGTWGGNEVDYNTANPGTNTITISGTGLVYRLEANKTSGNDSQNTTFNITGLSNTNGSFAYISLKASKTAIGASAQQIVGALRINGSANILATTLDTGIGGSSANIYRQFTVVYINGSWTAFNTSASSPNNSAFPVTADLAEQYSSTQSLEPGDIVAVAPGGYKNIERSSTPTQQNLLGVVSTAPWQVLGSDEPGYPVALSGRIPTKVNLEGGIIHKGDKITSSSTPGVGMKANAPGMVIGTALEDYVGPDTGTIEVFAGLSYYNPLTENTIQGSTSFSDINVSGLAVIQDLTVTGVATFQSNITINGHIITGGNTPEAVTLPAAGTDGSGNNDSVCTVSGNDTSGDITLTTGTSLLANGAQCTLSFSMPFTHPPHTVLSPLNEDSARIGVYVTVTTDTMTLNFTNQPLPAHTFIFSYINLQ